MAIDLDFNLAPKDAIDYLNGKGFELSYNYDELVGEIQHKVFTVAKVTRLDLLQDIHSSLVAAQKSGIRFDDWLKDIKPNLQKKGWWGEKEIIDKRTGEVRTVRIGSRRLKHIFRTNMRVAHSVQRYKKMRALTNAVYWRYVSALKPTTRDDHSRLHGVTLHRDNPFWNINYPPNDHGCLCKVRAYTEKELKRRKISIEEKAPDSIAHPDWAHDVGAGSKISGISKLELDNSLQVIRPNTALDELTDAQLKSRFYQQLNIEEGGLYIDKVGDPMWVSEELFTAAIGHSKLKKRNRHLYIDELAKTISDPDEIFLELQTLDKGGSRIVKRMFRYFQNEKGKTQAFVSTFKYEKDKTIGITAHVIDKQTSVDKSRRERLIYRKDSEVTGD